MRLTVTAMAVSSNAPLCRWPENRKIRRVRDGGCRNTAARSPFPPPGTHPRSFLEADQSVAPRSSQLARRQALRDLRHARSQAIEIIDANNSIQMVSGRLMLVTSIAQRM